MFPGRGGIEGAGMEYRELGTTGLRVSSVCLGTMTWGSQNTEREAHQQMDCAVDAGINFFDTAELYPSPPSEKTQGLTEQYIGSWFTGRPGLRQKIVLASKVLGRTEATYFRKSREIGRLSRAHIFEAVESSLKRLRTDYLDLYQTHWPDRDITVFRTLNYKHSDDDGVPIEETVQALADLVKQGKIRHYGISNETAWGTMRYLSAGERLGAPRIASIQNVYSLVSRNFEHGLSEISLREKVGLLAYSPLAQGYLTGKYQNGALPEGSRKKLYNRLQRYETPNAAPAIDAYLALARASGLDPVQMALQFVLSRPFVTAAIVGATSTEQLKTAIAAKDLKLSEEILRAIDDINIRFTYPCP
jgi:aryl-alcohol dehydrogenase-like predicted oxidoreductase